MQENINMDEPQVIETPAVEPQDPVETPPVVEVEKAPVFETLDDYNKHIQSTASKAKNELLKEIGFNSVSTIKEALEKGASIDAIREELELSKTEIETLRLEKKTNDDNKLLEFAKVPAEYGKVFLDLVNADTSEQTREEKALKVKQTLAGILQNELPDVKIGTTKTPSNEKSYEDQIKELQKL